jgi:hypothetical protein
VKQGEKLSRVPLHSIRTPNSNIKPREGSIWRNINFYMGEGTEGEIFLLILGMRGMQCNVEFGYQLRICSKDRGKPRKILIELAIEARSSYNNII